MAIDLPPDAPQRPAMVTEHVLGEDRLRQRGATLAGEALADWSLLTPAGRGVSLSGLPGTIVLLDSLRLTPAADGKVDLSMLPLAWLTNAELSAGPVGLAQGAGSIAGALNLSLAQVGSDSRIWALGGAQSGRGIGGIDVRAGDEFGWIGGGFMQGGALATPVGLAATGQGRWHLGGRFAQDLGGATVSGRALLASRREGGERADYHDLALQLRGGGQWNWHVAVATGGHHQATASSRQLVSAVDVNRATGLTLPGAVDPVSVAMGGELRRLRLGAERVWSRELFAEAYVPLLQDRPAAENLALELGWRQAWIAGRSEPLWKARARWEFFPGLAIRAQVARGIDDLATHGGIGRSIGLVAVPVFLPGVALAVDWRSQTAGPARVQAVDVALSLRHSIAGSTNLLVNVMATQHRQARFTPLPVARFQSLLRVGVEHGPWVISTGWRHRSSLAGEPARSAIDASLERHVTDKVRLVASISNAADAGVAPVGRQAMLQLVAGF
ncbi:hypothetical protein [Sandarakinorhabdus sp.]|uniref:hypothetical protein n=1 Tax=Sandarakinorhabdus sp. TaxID=1916663 RepID=UPI003341AD52